MQTRSLKIFIVENHKDTLQSLKLYFEDLGHEVETAETVAEAVSTVGSYKPDLMLCDIGLPDGTGWDLLKGLNPKPRMTVAMSGFGMHADNARSREAGFSAHLLKPFKVAELDRIVAEATCKVHPAGVNELRNSSPSKWHDVAQAIEREQRRIGEQLHDSVCQTLAGSNLLLESMGKVVAAGKPVAPEAFKKLRSIVEDTIRQTRGLSQQFAPISLEGGGLMLALETLASETPNCVFECEEPVFVADPRVALALYRIAQEAVWNAVRHAKSGSIRVKLRALDRRVVLRVEDDGKGFLPGEVQDGWNGLATMKLRAADVEGVLEVQSAPGRGTTVQCSAPSGK